VPGASRITINVNDYLAASGVPTPINISVKVTADVPIVAERPLYFNVALAGGVDGGTDVIGAREAATVHSFAEGTVRPGFVEFLTIQNPGVTNGTATLTFQASTDAGAPVSVPIHTVGMPGNSRVTINVNDYLAAVAVATPINISVKVTSDVPVVAERPLYFNVALAGGVDGGTDVIGARDASTAHSFAEGTVRPGFVEFLTLQNPGATNGTATFTFQASSDAGGTVVVPVHTLAAPANSRVTFNINDYLAASGVPTPINISVKVTSDVPIVAERPLYFNVALAGGVDGGTDVIGARDASTAHSFAEGTVRPGFVEFLTLQNPGATSGTATLTFQAATDAGAPVSVPPRTVVVSGSSRVTINVNDYLAAAGVPTPVNISVKVSSDVPIVAERPLYFNVSLAGGVNGGTDVIGSPD
jgi:uncharacterized membrane protein